MRKRHILQAKKPTVWIFDPIPNEWEHGPETQVNKHFVWAIIIDEKNYILSDCSNDPTGQSYMIQRMVGEHIFKLPSWTWKARTVRTFILPSSWTKRHISSLILTLKWPLGAFHIHSPPSTSKCFIFPPRHEKSLSWMMTTHFRMHLATLAVWERA